MAPTDTHLEDALSCMDDQDSVKAILAQCNSAERNEVDSCVHLAHMLQAHRHDLDPSHELLTKTLNKFQECREHADASEQKEKHGTRSWFRVQSVTVLLVIMIAVVGGLSAFRNTPQQGKVAVHIPATNEPNAVNINATPSGTTKGPATVSVPKLNTNSMPTNAPQNQQLVLDTSSLTVLAGKLGNDLNSYDQDVAALQGLASDQTLATAGTDMTTVTQL